MKLQFCFSTELPAGFHVANHAHEDLELVYYLEGKGKTLLGKTLHSFSRNSFAVIPAGIKHDEQVSDPIRTVCVGLSQSGLESFAGCHTDPGGDLRRICEKLLRESRERKPGYARILQGLALEIAGTVERIGAEIQNPRGKSQLVEKALSIIRETGGNVKVRQLADDLFVSEDYLSHLIRNKTQHSPIRHIIAERMERAKQALTHSSESLTEIAGRCGFESAHYFSRLFKKNFVLTPAAFRNFRKSSFRPTAFRQSKKSR